MASELFPASGINSTLGKIDDAFANASGADIASLDFSKLTTTQADAVKAKVISNATASTAGVVKLAAVTATVSSADASASTIADATEAAGDAPTKAEFDAVVSLVNDLKSKNAAAVALINELKAKLNSVIDAQRSAGQAASE